MNDNTTRVKTTLLNVKMVSHTRAGGRVGRFSVSVIVGNGDGMIGYGSFSALTVKKAREHAQRIATSRMKTVTRDSHGCVPFDFEIRRRGVKLRFLRYKTRDKIVANPKLFALLELAGIRAGMIKVYGTFNLDKVIKMLIERLTSLPTHNWRKTTHPMMWKVD